MAADLGKDDLGGVGQARALGLQRRGIEQHQRHVRRFVGLQVDRGDAGHRPFGEVRPGQGGAHQVDQLGGFTIALATHAQRQARRMQHQRPRIVLDRPFGDDHAMVALGCKRQAVEPTGLALEDHGFARQQRGHHGLRGGRVRNGPAGGRFVQRDTEAGIACRRHRGMAAQQIGTGTRQGIGAMVSADQRHRSASVLGHGNDRSLVELVGQMRRHRADQDARRADPDHRHARGKQGGDMVHRVVEGNIGYRYARRKAVQPRTRQARHQLARHGLAARPQAEHGNTQRKGHRQASPRR